MSEFELSVNEEYHGSGELLLAGQAFALSVIRLSRSKYSSRSPWKIEAFFTPETLIPIDLFWKFADESSVRGYVEFNRSFFISKLDGVRLSPGGTARIRGTFHEVQFDLEDLPCNPMLVDLSAIISPTDVVPEPFGIEQFNEDGQLFGSNARPAQELNFSLGSARLRQESFWERPRGTANLDVRLQIPTVQLRVPPAGLGRNVKLLLQSFINDVETLCQILSFASRQSVAWIEATAAAAGEFEDERIGKDPQILRNYPVPQPTTLLPLLAAQLLPVDAFATMVSALVTSPIRPAVELSISQMIAATVSGSPELRLVNSFASLEALVSAIAKQNKFEYALGTAAFKRLASVVRGTVRKTLSEDLAAGKISQWQVDDLLDKVSELRRRPIVNRIRDVVSTMEIKWQDLWPEGTSLEDGLHKAYALRNAVVHSGLQVEAALARRELLRMRALSERIVFRLLSGRDEWLHPLAYSHTSMLSMKA